MCQLLLVNQWICQALLYCYCPALPVLHIRDGFAKHCFIFRCIRKTAKINSFIMSAHLSICINQWICQAPLYCYCPALPVLHIRDGFAKHYFIFRCIRKTAKIDLASSFLPICLSAWNNLALKTDFLGI